jgi:hypothetical protein
MENHRGDRCNFSGRLVHCLLINYPAEEEHAWDDVVTRMSLSLNGKSSNSIRRKTSRHPAFRVCSSSEWTISAELRRVSGPVSQFQISFNHRIDRPPLRVVSPSISVRQRSS